MDLITTKTINRIFWIAINLSYLTIALKDVRVTVPTAVKRGDNANLTCHYDLENDTLYSIKWYKGNREFYRYLPREDIPMKVFPVNGITVERSMSNASNVMLTSMEPNSTGKYSCEVSADAPTFHTNIVSGELEVIELPNAPPRIDIEDKIYSIGNMLLANCTVDNSKPLANLTWLLNNNTLRPHEIIHYNIVADSSLNSKTSVQGLKLVLQSKHFRYKNLRLACTASIYNIYVNTTEKILELNTTSNQIYTDDFITIGSSRHTQYDGDFNGYSDPYDIRMHHMQASPDRSTSSSAMSLCSKKKCYSYSTSFLLYILTSILLYCCSNTNNSITITNTNKISNSKNNNSKKIKKTDNNIIKKYDGNIDRINSTNNNNNSNNKSMKSILIIILYIRIISSSLSLSSRYNILEIWSKVQLKKLLNINKIYEKSDDKKNILSEIQVVSTSSSSSSLSTVILSSSPSLKKNVNENVEILLKSKYGDGGGGNTGTTTTTNNNL